MGNKKSYYAIIPANVRYDESLTPNAKLLYGEVTALCNEKGYCWASNSYFAALYGVSNKSISQWVNQLVDKGYLTSQMQYREGSKEILHRYLRIANNPIEEKVDTYGKKVPHPMEENVHTYGRKGNGPMEEKVKDNTTLNNTSNNTSNNKSKTDGKPSEKVLKNDFDELWKEYPNKKSKQVAFNAYKKAIKDGVTNQEILDGITAYNKEIQFKRTEPTFIAHGSTWFNQRRWEDDYTTGAKVLNATFAEEAPTDESEVEVPEGNQELWEQYLKEQEGES